MLYETPELEPVDKAVLEEIEDMRRELRYRLAEHHRCDGRLRRRLQARAIQGSNAIEGYHASVEDIESIMLGEEPLETSAAVAGEIVGYQRALTYIRHLSAARSFHFDLGLLNALNFMMIGHHPGGTPGTLRPGGGYIRDSATGEVVYEGPDAERIPGLLNELIERLDGRDSGVPGMVRAAMAHLNLMKIHPWHDGNGRMSRALHTLVLGRERIIAPEFCSIEEWLGEEPARHGYHDVLREVGHNRWSPHGETLPWVRFCLRAHHLQAQRVRRRLVESGQVWLVLEERIEKERLHARCVSALYQVYVSRRLRRGTYQADESLSQGQAARDLRELAARDWLTPYGETKGRFYAPGPRIEQVKAEFAARIEPLRDPYQAACPG